MTMREILGFRLLEEWQDAVKAYETAPDETCKEMAAQEIEEIEEEISNMELWDEIGLKPYFR